MNTQPLPSTFLPLVSPQQVPLPRTTTRRPLRLGVVGVGNSPDSSGGHIARHLASLGADLTAVADPQRDDIDAMLARERLDAVAICSPVQWHREHLRSALAHGVHVLCEKPLLLESGRDPVTDARPLVEGFAKAGKLLMLNEPWPYTLSSFDDLYPAARIFSRPPQHLAVLLCPSTPGFEMITSAVPHALSLLFSLCPSGGLVERLRVESNDVHDGVTTALTISFQYIHSAGRTNVSIDLCQMSQSPRPAGYSIDGRSVRRVVQMPDYQLYFVAHDTSHGGRLSGTTLERPQRRVPITDPLRLLLSDFLRRVQQAEQGARGEGQADATLLERLGLLRTIYAVARTALSAPSPSGRGPG